MTAFTRRPSGRASLCALVCLLAVAAWPSAAFAQATPTNATLTEWDVFTATGGGSTASQNVAAVLLDVNGKAGTAGNVWLTTQRPLPRIGSLNPATTANNYTEWRPVPSTMSGGAPLGLALNAANGDLWMALQGDPSFIVKTANSNVFRRFRTSSPLIPHGITVASDGAAIAALPSVNGAGIGNAIVKVPKGGASGSSVSITLWNIGGEPHDVALDGSGNIWFSARLANKIGKLNTANGLVTEWLLPSGTHPMGLRISGTLVCVASEGLAGSLDGVEHCLNTANNQITTYARAAGDGFNQPQQPSINSDSETFLTEQNGDAISFVAFAARAAATVTTVAPTTRTVSPTTSTLVVSDVTVTPTTYSITPTTTPVSGADNGGGYVRFPLPAVPVTYPTAANASPQPVSVTPVFNDGGRGTGSVYFGQYFSGTLVGRFAAARVGRLVLTAAAPQPAVIVANPQTLQFDAVVGQAAPGSQALAVTEADGNALAWTATKTASWLTLSPASGNAPSSITVTANHASLAAGTYTDTITIDDGPGNAVAKTVAVTLNVTQANLAPLSPTSLTFAATAGGALPDEQTVTITNTGTGTLDWTATANQSWVVIRQTSGTAPSTIRITINPVELGGGTATATLTIASTGALNSPRTLTITANITGPPTIALNPASMTFSATKGGAVPAAQTLTITNSGSGTLQWALESDSTWLTAATTSGSTAAAASSASAISINHTTLARGTYVGNLSVVDPDAGNSPQAIPVTLTVTAPTIGVSPSAIPLSIVKTGNPANQTVAISNAGDAPLNYTATVTDGGSWLSVSSGATGAVAAAGSTNMVLAFNASSLPRGVHTATVEIADPNATNSPQTVTVTLTVTAPTITLGAGTLTYAVNQGSSPASQTVTVSNSGDAALTFTPAVATVSGGSWLSVSPAGAATLAPGGSTTLTVSVASASLAPGSYSGSITISDSTATNTPQTIGTSLAVNAIGILGVSPTAIPLTAIKGGANPANQTVTISNSGGANLTYATSVTSGAGWLSVVSGGGGTVASSGSAALVLGINTSSLNKGVHTGTVQVTAPDNAPQTITVTLTVQAATISLSPTSLTYTVLRSRNPATQTITVSNTGDATMNFAAAASTVSGGSWLSVSPASGTLAPGANTTLTATVTSAALASGSHTGSVAVTDANASNSPQTTAVALTVNPAPTITPSAGSLTYTVSQGLNPANQTVTITNTGDGSLTFTPAVTTVSGGSWLSVSPSGATTIAAGASQILTVSIASASLPSGSYSGNIQIADANATNTPQNITVGLTVNAAAIIGRNPPTLTFSALRTRNPSPQTQSISVTNNGDATLNFTASASMAQGGGWLAVSPASAALAPGASTTLTVTVTSSGLATGSYGGTITIADPAATNSPQTTAVSLTVNAAPTITLGAANLSFTVSQGLNPASQTVTVTNSGDGSLTFTPAVTTVSGGSWLTVSPAGATTLAAGASTTLTVSVASSSLAAGSYSGNIEIADANATNTPQSVGVAWTVNAAPIISLDPTSLTFSVLRGRNPATQTITLTNSGGATLNFNASAAIAQGSGWLAVSPASGSVAPGLSVTLTVTVTSSALASGSFNGTISVADVNATNSPQTASVALTVNPAPTIALGAASLSFSATQTENPAATQSVTVTNSGDAPLTFTPQIILNSGSGWLAVSPAGATTIAAGGNQALTVTVTSASLAPGVYTGVIRVSDANATNDPQDVAVSVTVNAAPVISRTPATLTFTAKRTTNPVTQDITLTNSGGASMTWSAAATMATGSGWLAVSPASGTLSAGASTTLTVTVTSSALTTGSYTGNIAISAPGTPAGNSPQNTGISLSVTAAPTITRSPASLTFTATQTLNPAGTQTFTVTNSGDASLTFTPQVIMNSGSGWLAVSPTTPVTLAAGATSGTFTVTVTSASLAPGPYTGAIRIADANATVTPVDVVINLTVNAAPVISRSPATMTFTAFRTKNPSPNTQAITLTNAGGASMSWTAAATMTNGSGWLAVSPASGTLAAGATTTLTVTVTSTALASGSFTGNVAISATGAPGTNSPQNTSVSLTVNPAATISLSVATAISVSGNEWKTCNAAFVGANPTVPTFTVTNSGDIGSTLNWTATATTTSGGSWLTVTPASGALARNASTTLTVTIDTKPGGVPLNSGTYTGSIVVADPNATNGSMTRSVTLTVNNSGVMCVTPVSLAFGNVPRTATSAAQTVTLSNVGDAAFSAGWSTATTQTSGSINRSPASAAALLAAGASVNISVTVTASTQTARNNVAQSGTITFTSTGTANSGVQVPVTWTQVP